MTCSPRAEQAASVQLLDATRHPIEVARDVLGMTLVCRGTAAVIVEVEAYHQDEPAAHSFGGVPTPRTQQLFGVPGTCYVYFTYGMHWCANLVTGPEGSGEAVLLRGAVPVVGEQTMRARRAAGQAVGSRGSDPASWRVREIAGGPARLTQALDIRADDNGRQLLDAHAVDIETALALSADGPVLLQDVELAAQAGVALPVPDADLLVGPRIGITKAVELPWRLGVRNSPGLSRAF